MQVASSLIPALILLLADGALASSNGSNLFFGMDTASAASDGGSGGRATRTLTTTRRPAASSTASSTAAASTSGISVVSTTEYNSDGDVVEVITTEEQAIPAMETVEEVVVDESDDAGGLASQKKTTTMKRPSWYKPLLDGKRAAASPASNLQRFLESRPPPAIQQLATCNYDQVHKDMMAMLNRVRVARLKKVVDAKKAPLGSLCMNGKLMMAAKLQSDFQALAKVPTHAGPRISRLGSLEERIAWASFGRRSKRKAAIGEGAKNPLLALAEGALVEPLAGAASAAPPSRKSSRYAGRVGVAAEELIYFWPKQGEKAALDREAMRGLMKEALSAWLSDSSALAVLSNPVFKFFGMGLTRSPGGAMYLTVVLAAAPREVCNVCASVKPRARHEAFSDEEFEDISQ